MTTSITILGSTGTIGTRALDVVSHLGEDFVVKALVAGSNASLLAEQIRRFHPEYVSVRDETTRASLIELLGGRPGVEIGVGDAGMTEAARLSTDVVLSSVVGAKGLKPTFEAVARGAKVALANKETLVAAGDLVMAEAKRSGSEILPVDSEHSALLQCLHAGKRHEVKRFIVTASGGPFRTWSPEELAGATVEQALKHPNWTMGRKITIDSATLMNKGLEVIEAHHLFEAPYDSIDVVVHPQSVIHSMVEFADGSMMAQLATADMRLPIQYALTYPHRTAAPWPSLDLLSLGQLTFEAPDRTRFPSLRIAYEAGRAGGYAPCVMNAANEVAVEAFLNGALSYTGIARVVETVLDRHAPGVPQQLDDVLHMDEWARTETQAVLTTKGGW